MQHFRFRLLAGLLLGALAVAAVAAAECSGTMGCLRLQQLSADKWEVFSDGHPVRQNVFCRTTLSVVTRTTTNASRALVALCDAQDNSTFFSGSALDTWMVARFINYSTSLDVTRAERPMSTEPNTPWMLADVVLSSSQEQRRTDSWRKVRGDAQLDLMLCSDPSWWIWSRCRRQGSCNRSSGIRRCPASQI